MAAYLSIFSPKVPGHPIRIDLDAERRHPRPYIVNKGAQYSDSWHEAHRIPVDKILFLFVRFSLEDARAARGPVFVGVQCNGERWLLPIKDEEHYDLLLEAGMLSGWYRALSAASYHVGHWTPRDGRPEAVGKGGDLTGSLVGKYSEGLVIVREEDAHWLDAAPAREQVGRHVTLRRRAIVCGEEVVFEATDYLGDPDAWWGDRSD